MAERQEESSRPHALDIYERICDDTAEELDRPQGSIFYSALFAGFAIGLSALAVALTTVVLTPEVKSTAFVAALLYPIGYLVVIIGRSQFFTENTLYPVMLSMRRHEFLNRTGRLWTIVFAMNLVGALIFALLVVKTDALDPAVQSELVSNGVKYTEGSFVDTFWSAVIVGFLLASVAWLVEGCDTVTGRIAVVWSLTFLVSLGSLDHSIATTVTAFAALLEGDLALGDASSWLAAAFLGNVFGGVVIVAAINYGQVREED